MELSVKHSGNCGNGLFNNQFIPKGVCFLIEECFCSSKPNNNSKRVQKLVESGMEKYDQGTVFVVACLLKKTMKSLRTFIARHAKTSFPLLQREAQNLRKIAEIFKRDLQFVKELYFCIENNSFGSSFLVMCKYFEQYLYDKASYANHQCIDFNTEWVIDPTTKVIKFFARRDIQAGEWITITYLGGNEMLSYQARNNLPFKCDCIDCVLQNDGVMNLFGISSELKRKYSLFGITSPEQFAEIVKKHNFGLIYDKCLTYILFGELIQLFEKAIETNFPSQIPIAWKHINKSDRKFIWIYFQYLVQSFDPLNVHEARFVLLSIFSMFCLGFSEDKMFDLLKIILLSRETYYKINESQMFGAILTWIFLQ